MADDTSHITRFINPKVIDSPEYQLISEHYRGRHARRSGLPYIKHINDGLVILEHIGAHFDAMRAYCIHPILQDTSAFQEAVRLGDDRCALLSKSSPTALVLATEYRNIANAYLLRHHKTHDAASQGNGDQQLPTLSPIDKVNDMLRADKIQNFHDFLNHHYQTHPDSDALYSYFNQWFKALNVDYDKVVSTLPTSL